MPQIHAKQALLATGWAQDVRLDIGEGRINDIAIGGPARAQQGAAHHHAVDVLLPAPGNLHSHAFQRAMAGLTEHRVTGRDSFWTWRDVMYRFTSRLGPDQVEAIAAQAYVEMLEAGYASVGEFHYLHHQPNGADYDDPAELSARILAAANEVGIGLTHLPVLYTCGGAGAAPLQPGQARFGCDVDRFSRLVAAVRGALASMPGDTCLGVAPHSLRATTPGDLARLIAAYPRGPVHIHAAEQPAEVADIEAWLGARPVQWLLDNAAVDERWCLIHATHMTAQETRNLAASGAVAGLCPITEANLGDGPFNAPGFVAAGGRFGIGSDSNVRIALGEELRMLEYSQRLRDLERNVIGEGEGSVGAFVFEAAARGAAQALGRGAGQIQTGAWADLLAVDADHPALCALPLPRLLDGLVFAAGRSPVTDVWSAGRHMVRGGRHIAREAIARRFRTAMHGLVGDW